MSKEHPKYLRNKNTGAIQTWTESKAAMPFMEPCDDPPEPREPVSLRTKRPFDEEQERRSKLTKANAARDSVLADSDEPEFDLGDLALSADDLDEAEQKVNSALKKEDIAAVAVDYFAIEIPDGQGVKRATMKDQVRQMIEAARRELEKA